jgi:protein-disulfide isomerase
VLYFAYASFFILNAVCLLCVGTYAAIIALFLISGAAARYPMSSLPGRASNDLRTLMRTPAALGAALAFVAAAAIAVVVFPSEPISASAAPDAAQGAGAVKPALPPPPASEIARLEQFLAQQPRKPIIGAGSGAAVVIYKFNDYQCPPCGMTFREYKPFLAKLQKEYPGKIAFITRDFPLDPECNTAAPGGSHVAACEAAVAVRLAREKGQARADAMEDWLFANQPTLTPATVKDGAAKIGGVTDFDARYPQTLELVKGDIAQGRQLGVGGTPTFFMNGMQLPNFNRGEYFEAAVLWELRRLGAAK